MASLTKKPNSKFWFACFRDRGGKQHRRSTGETNERKALEIARRYEQVAQRKLKPAKFRETLVELYREVYGTTVPKATVREFAEEWLKVKKPEVAQSSWDKYKKSIDKFLIFLLHDAELDISLIAQAHITAFRNDLPKRLRPLRRTLTSRPLRGCLEQRSVTATLMTIRQNSWIRYGGTMRREGVRLPSLKFRQPFR